MPRVRSLLVLLAVAAVAVVVAVLGLVVVSRGSRSSHPQAPRARAPQGSPPRKRPRRVRSRPNLPPRRRPVLLSATNPPCHAGPSIRRALECPSAEAVPSRSRPRSPVGALVHAPSRWTSCSRVRRVRGRSWSPCREDRGAPGTRSYLADFAQLVAGQGAVVFVADYRESPEWGGGSPTTYQDIACAIRFARAHAAEYGGDGRRVTFVAHSWAPSSPPRPRSPAIHSSRSPARASRPVDRRSPTRTWGRRDLFLDRRDDRVPRLLLRGFADRFAGRLAAGDPFAVVRETGAHKIPSVSSMGSSMAMSTPIVARFRAGAGGRRLRQPAHGHPAGGSRERPSAP